MRLFSIGNSNAPCLVLRWNGVSIMFDCGLDIQPLLQFLPSSFLENLKKKSSFKHDSNKILHNLGDFVFIESNEMKIGLPDWSLMDLSDIDVLLISNSSNILALPYLTEYTNFDGIIYATEPTIQIGKHFMKELVLLMEEQNESLKLYTKNCTKQWQETNILENISNSLQSQLQGAWKWRSLYNLPELQRSIDKVQPLNYHETKSIFSLLKITPISSGFCLGGANWVIETSHEKVIYVSDTSIITPRHPEVIDSKSLGRNNTNITDPVIKISSADVILLSNTCISSEIQSPPDQMVPKALGHIGFTINNGGNVLIPTYSCGIIFDMFENIKNYLLQRMKRAPIYFISPVAEHSLAYANIIAEWLSKERQEKVYLPESPFLHEEMINSSLLYHFKTLEELFESGYYQEPCIIFAGHPTLRCGPASKILNLWRQHENSTVLFLEPGIDYAKAISPYQPLKIKVHSCPIDWRVSSDEISNLLKEIKPKQVVIPEKYSLVQGNSLNIQIDSPPIIYGEHGVYKIHLKRKYERAILSSKLAKQLVPNECGNLLFTDFNASMSTFDNKYSFYQASLSDIHILKLQRQRHITGSLDIEKLIEELNKIGYKPSSVTKSNNETILLFHSNIKIIFTSTSTTIHCNNDKIRNILTRCILQQCQDLTN